MGYGVSAALTSLAGLGLTWLLQSTALLALGLLAGRTVKRVGPALQSGIYRTTLAAVLVCPAASALLAWGGFAGFALLPPAAEPVEPAGRIEMVTVATRESRARSIPSVMPEVSRSSIEPGRAKATAAATPGPAPVAPLFRAPLWSQAAVLGLTGWLLGAALLACRLLVAQRRMGQVRASAIPAEADVEALCTDLAQRLRLSPPKVLRSPFLFSPCLFGIRRPAILLPDDAGGNLRETFLHELAHLARRDGHWNLLRHCAVATLWVQPLLWVLSRRIEAAAEEVCDDYVVHFGADRARYAGHLLDLGGRALPPAAPSGVGMITLRSMLARRIVRILDPSRRLSTRAGTRAVVAMLAAGLAGTLLAGLIGVDGPSPKAQAQVQVKAQPVAKRVAVNPEAAAGKDATIRGRVVDPDGNPVAGATVIASRSQLPPDLIGNPFRAPKLHEGVRVHTDADGRYAVTLENAQVVAMAPGFGIGCRIGDGPIRLAPGGPPVTGRLVDLEGRPYAGAKIRLVQLEIPMESPGNRPPASTSKHRIGIDPEPALLGGTQTDADGRFRIDGLGRDVLLRLEISGPNVAYRWVSIDTGLTDKVPGRPADPSVRGVDEPGTFGADCTIVIEPSRPIEGFVRDIRTGEPIAGAVVTAGQLAGSLLDIEGMISATTDVQGHYRLTGLPKADGHKLSVYPPLDRPYFVTRFQKVPAGPGVEPVRFDFALRPGQWITGTVSDAATGKPVQAAVVAYYPFLSNEHAKDYPNFDAAISMSIDFNVRYRTGVDGGFRVVGLPGRGVVVARSERPGYRTGVGAEAIEGRTQHKQLLTYERIWPDRYHALKVVDPAAGDRDARCDLKLDPGRSLKVHLVDPEGAPLTHATAHGRYPELIDDNDQSLDTGNVATVAGLEPGRRRTVIFNHRERKLGAVLIIPPEGPDTAELTMTLRSWATVTGRIVDGQGKPARGGVRINLPSGNPEVYAGIEIASKNVDADGRFRIDNLPPGGRFDVKAVHTLVYSYGMKMKPDDFKDFKLATDLPAEPGQVIDLGTFDVKAGRRIDH